MRAFHNPFLPAAAILLAACSRTACAAADRFDEVVQAEMVRQKIPGVAIAVIHKGTIKKLAGYGFANVEHNAPATAETVFHAGSTAKQLTAMAVMLQVEEGKLSLDDPITKFFPDAPPGWQAILIRNLLTHTSGIADYTFESVDQLRRDVTDDEFARLAYGLKLEFPPGARWNYSNTGYVLLGIIVQKVTGRSYGEILRERIFVPLGMKTARVFSEEDIVPHRSAGYQLVKGELKNQEWMAPSLNATPDGGLYLSATDWAAFAAGIRTKAVLKPESWAEMFKPVRLNSGRTYPYGFGWVVDDEKGQTRHHHGGRMRGFRTYISRYVDEDLIVVVLTNLSDADAEEISDRITALINQRLGPTKLSPIPDPEPQVAERLAALLRATAQGELAPTELAYVRAGFFPDLAESYQEQLRNSGPMTGTDLLQRRQVGDDWIYTYRVKFGTKSLRAKLGIAPDGKISVFSIEPERG
jgi:CubicO group peptidase (beta-lactamase class C family)